MNARYDAPICNRFPQRSSRLLLGLILILLAAGLCLPRLGLADVQRGTELAQRVYDRPDGTDQVTYGTMTLIEPGRSPRQRQLYTFRREAAVGEMYTLIRFVSPADIENTGLLTRDYPDGSTDQWVYLPALDRARRIAADRKGGRFVGSDLFYEDLQDRKVDQDQHRHLGMDTLHDVAVERLESIPTDPNNSVYSKRLSWIHPETLIPLRIDFFSPGDTEPSKRLEVHRIEPIQGYWTVMDSTMTDLNSGHQTRMTVERIRYDQGLPDALFSQQALTDPAREQPYRP